MRETLPVVFGQPVLYRGYIEAKITGKSLDRFGEVSHVRIEFKQLWWTVEHWVHDFEVEAIFKSVP